MMEYDVCLNIHASAPEAIWNKIDEVYRTMPYWHQDENYPHWTGDGIDIYASVEPGGIQIAGTMPETVWNTWYPMLKTKLTNALGYEIGEPEEGYSFKYWKPFRKKYAEIKSIDSEKIVFQDFSTFFWEDFEKTERDISADLPYFAFKSSNIELYIFFAETGAFSKKKNRQNFRDFQSELQTLGIRTPDLAEFFLKNSVTLPASAPIVSYESKNAQIMLFNEVKPK